VRVKVALPRTDFSLHPLLRSRTAPGPFGLRSSLATSLRNESRYACSRPLNVGVPLRRLYDFSLLFPHIVLPLSLWKDQGDLLDMCVLFSVDADAAPCRASSTRFFRMKCNPSEKRSPRKMLQSVSFSLAHIPLLSEDKRPARIKGASTFHSQPVPSGDSLDVSPHILTARRVRKRSVPSPTTY